jgi:Arc/MetJ-type ribon-helix-helix transcriptional regulator
MSIVIPANFSQAVQSWISQGRFRDEREVVVEGLRLVAMRERLHEDIQAGIKELDAGSWVDGEAVFAELRERSENARSQDKNR